MCQGPVEFIKKKKENSINSSDKESIAEAERPDVEATGLPVLIDILFNEKLREQIKTHRHHCLRFCHNNGRLSGVVIFQLYFHK